MTEPKRYLLLPGHVVSKADGELHYLDAPELARLYGVRLSDCDVHYPGMPAPSEAELLRMVWLYPRTDGVYSLPDPGPVQREDPGPVGCPIVAGSFSTVRWGVIAGGLLLAALVLLIAWALLAFV